MRGAVDHVEFQMPTLLVLEIRRIALLVVPRANERAWHDAWRRLKRDRDLMDPDEGPRFDCGEWDRGALGRVDREDQIGVGIPGARFFLTRNRPFVEDRSILKGTQTSDRGADQRVRRIGPPSRGRFRSCFSLVYLLLSRLFRLTAGSSNGLLDTEVELIVLRHQLKVLTCQAGRPRLHRPPAAAGQHQ
jgi:hypothetical protein